MIKFADDFVFLQSVMKKIPRIYVYLSVKRTPLSKPLCAFLWRSVIFNDRLSPVANPQTKINFANRRASVDPNALISYLLCCSIICWSYRVYLKICNFSSSCLRQTLQLFIYEIGQRRERMPGDYSPTKRERKKPSH